MAAKTIQNFWSAVRGTFAGLVGRRTDGSEDGVTVAVGDDGDIHPFKAAGEDVVADRQLVEEEWELWSSTTEGQVKSSPGKLGHVHITCATAGTVTFYNSATETGDVIDTFTFGAAGSDRQDFYFPFDTALYCGFDATFAGRVTVLYR